MPVSYTTLVRINVTAVGDGNYPGVLLSGSNTTLSTVAADSTWHWPMFWIAVGY